MKKYRKLQFDTQEKHRGEAKMASFYVDSSRFILDDKNVTTLVLTWLSVAQVTMQTCTVITITGVVKQP